MDCLQGSVTNNMPYPVRSKALPWSAGQTGNDFPLDVLIGELGRNVNPLALGFDLRFTGSITCQNTEAARAQLYAQIFDRVFLTDKAGAIVDLRGEELRAVVQQEQGIRFSDVTVSGTGNLSGGAGAQTVANFELIIPFKFDMIMQKRRADARVRVKDLLDMGAKMTIDFCAAVVGPASTNRFTVNSGNYEVVWWLLDEGTDENGDPGVRTRYEWRSYAIETNRKGFPVRGRFRYGLQYIGKTGENKATPDTWAAMNLNIPTLAFAARPSTYYVSRYLQEHAIRNQDPAGVLANQEDMVRVGTVIPILPVEADQGLTERPEIDSLWWESDVSFGTGTFNSTNSPRMIICSAVDRPGCEAPSYTKTAEGGQQARVSSAQVASSLASKLPGTESAPPLLNKA